jgi:hypothetical protein
VVITEGAVAGRLTAVGFIVAIGWLPAGWVRFIVGITLLLLVLTLGAWWLLKVRRSSLRHQLPCLCPTCGQEFRSEGALYAHSMTAHFREQ